MRPPEQSGSRPFEELEGDRADLWPSWHLQIAKASGRDAQTSLDQTFGGSSTRDIRQHALPLPLQILRHVTQSVAACRTSVEIANKLANVHDLRGLGSKEGWGYTDSVGRELGIYDELEEIRNARNTALHKGLSMEATYLWRGTVRVEEGGEIVVNSTAEGYVSRLRVYITTVERFLDAFYADLGVH